MPGAEDGATARQDRWARLRDSLWQSPRPHGEQPHERAVGPLELFYDLAVVVLIAQAARRLAGHLGWSGLGQFAVVFTLVWIAWANGSLHYELHGREDARSRSGQGAATARSTAGRVGCMSPGPPPSPS